jgi:hypothetical protein
VVNFESVRLVELKFDSLSVQGWINLVYYIMYFDTQQKYVEYQYLKTNIFQSWHTSRHNTRAGFDSAPQVSVEKGCSSIIRYGPSLKDVGAAHSKHPGFLLT